MDWLLERFKFHGERIAFNECETQISYEKFEKLIRESIQVFKNEGVRSGDGLILYGLGNSQMFAATLAAMKLGCIVSPLTHEAPIMLHQAKEILKPQWLCELSNNVMSIQKCHAHGTERAELLNTLAREGLGGLVLYSSGSSGKPKGILYDVDRLLEKFKKKRPPIKALSFLALDHFGGLNTVITIVSNGGEVVVLRDRKVDTVCAAIETHRVKILPVTPTFIRLLLASRAWTRYDMSSLEKITYGTEPMTLQAIQRLQHAFPGVELQQTYGLSELGVLSTKSRQDGSLWVKIGGSGFDVKIKNGILWIKSAYQMRGYLNADAEFDENGFFNTNDAVLVDGEYLQILGRSSDIINVGGEKVYPAEIENCIAELPNVESVVVYGKANSLLGQVVVADIVLEQPEDLGNLKIRVRQHCRSILGAQKVPNKIRIVTSHVVSSRHKTIRHAQ